MHLNACNFGKHCQLNHKNNAYVHIFPFSYLLLAKKGKTLNCCSKKGSLPRYSFASRIRSVVILTYVYKSCSDVSIAE